MRSVSRFEANLLRLLGYFLHREPPERAVTLLENRCSAPPCLHRDAIELVKDALAKGCVVLLARRGGWRRKRFLRGDRMVEGRLWERTPPAELGLPFSTHTLEFLIWITANRPGDKDSSWHPREEDLTLGDRLLLYFAHEGLRNVAEGSGARRYGRDSLLSNMVYAGWPFPKTTRRPQLALGLISPGQMASARPCWKLCKRSWPADGSRSRAARNASSNRKPCVSSVWRKSAS